MALGFLYGAGGGGGQPEPEIKALIPTMTSNNTPSGVASASSVYSSTYDAWKALNGVESGDANRWATANGVGSAWFKYAFNTPTVVKELIIQTAGPACTAQLQGSNDGITWSNIGSSFEIGASPTTAYVAFDSNKTKYIQYRLNFTNAAQYTFWKIQLYGYYPDYRPLTIYDSGSWSVGYDNPGSYTWAQATPAAFTLESDKLSKAASTGNAMIGTTNKIDLAKYSTVHVLAKAITFTSGGSNAGGLAVDPTDKEVASATMSFFTTLGQTVEYTVDVSTLASAYISIFSNSTAAVEIYKIWLT